MFHEQKQIVNLLKKKHTQKKHKMQQPFYQYDNKQLKIKV